MKILTIITFMASIWILFSCKDKQNKQVGKVETFQLQSKQDTINKKVKQTIFKEVTHFDYSDFYDLHHNKFYDRFLAGQINLPTGQVVCADPMNGIMALPQSWTMLLPKNRTGS